MQVTAAFLSFSPKVKIVQYRLVTLVVCVCVCVCVFWGGPVLCRENYFSFYKVCTYCMKVLGFSYSTYLYHGNILPILSRSEGLQNYIMTR